MRRLTILEMEAVAGGLRDIPDDDRPPPSSGLGDLSFGYTDANGNLLTSDFGDLASPDSMGFIVDSSGFAVDVASYVNAVDAGTAHMGSNVTGTDCFVGLGVGYPGDGSDSGGGGAGATVTYTTADGVSHQVSYTSDPKLMGDHYVGQAVTGSDNNHYQYESGILPDGTTGYFWAAISAQTYFNVVDSQLQALYSLPNLSSTNTVQVSASLPVLSGGVSQGPDPFGGNTDIYFTVATGYVQGTEVPVNVALSSNTYSTFSVSETNSMGFATVQNTIAQYSDANTWASGSWTNGTYTGTWTYMSPPSGGYQVLPGAGATLEMSVNLTDGMRYVIAPNSHIYTDFVNQAINGTVNNILNSAHQ